MSREEARKVSLRRPRYDWRAALEGP